MTTKITDSQFDILMDFYDDPDASLRPFLGLLNPNVAYQLENKGYITDAPSARGYYVLTSTGKEYIAQFRKQVEARRIKGMSVMKQEWVIKNKLDPSDENDRRLMMDMVENSPYEYIREVTISVGPFRETITKDEWNRLAHNRNRKVRHCATAYANIEEFADETYGVNVAHVIERCQSEGRTVPHELVERWYRNGNTGAVKAMSEADLDAVLDDGNVRFIVTFYHMHREMFDSKRIARVCAIVKEASGEDAWEIRKVARELLSESNHLSEALLRECADAWPLRDRLHEYCETYRKLRALERMFADPDCGFVRELRRHALEDEAAALG